VPPKAPPDPATPPAELFEATEPPEPPDAPPDPSVLPVERPPFEAEAELPPALLATLPPLARLPPLPSLPADVPPEDDPPAADPAEADDPFPVPEDEHAQSNNSARRLAFEKRPDLSFMRSRIGMKSAAVFAFHAICALGPRNIPSERGKALGRCD
jgi:hypothetical protein